MIIQIFIPVLSFNYLIIVPDVLIILLTFVGFYYGRFYTIILGFLLGLTQDLITQIELLGAMAFIKSAAGFGLGTLNLYANIWSSRFKLLFIFLIYNIHFFIFYFIKFNGLKIDLSIYFQIILINSLVSFIILYIIDKFLLDSLIASK